MILVEGSVFQNIKQPIEDGHGGRIFTSPDTNTNAQCASYLGRNCQANAYGSSGAFRGTDTSFLQNFKGKNVATASSANDAKKVVDNAGYGKI